MKKNKLNNFYVIGIVLILIVIALILFSSNKEVSDVDSNFDISRVASLNKLVFNLPNMDKQMCETFPRIILSSIESMEGVVDASFEFDGHVVSVYYAPSLVSKGEILNNEVYNWVGVNFISDEKVNTSMILEIYNNREKNNNLSMPGEHMSDIDESDNNKLINSQNFPPLVNSEWLFENMNNVKIIEIGPLEDYLEGHVNKSLYLDISKIRSTKQGIIKQVLPKKEFEFLLGNLGISENDRIVIYSSKNLNHASRLYWTFKYYGHKDVAIVDGGKQTLEKIFNRVGEETVFKSNDYNSKPNMKIIANSSYISKNMGNSEVVLLDVRSKEEFENGRIPGAINIDWTSFLNKDGTLKSVQELENLLKNVDKTKEIIVYCESGTRASYAWFVLSEVLGYKNVKLFDGSMIEWRVNKLPIEK